MDMQCPWCGAPATPAGHEDARAFFECRLCNRVWATELASFVDSSGPRPVRVLVVDDSAEMVGLLSLWLEDEGCTVVTALSGRQALDAAAVYYPDVVFLDLVLPPPDGFHVCRALRERLSPEVVLMTGMTDPEYSRRAEDLGVAAVLLKPLTRETVLDALAKALDRGRRDPLSGLRAHFGAHG